MSQTLNPRPQNLHPEQALVSQPPNPEPQNLYPEHALNPDPKI